MEKNGQQGERSIEQGQEKDSANLSPVPGDRTVSLPFPNEETPKEEEDQPNNPTTENNYMETHAHALHKAPGKGWKHYLFEFMMLFLAVTLGFIVENMREHIAEHERARQFLQSMLVDVRTNKKNLDSLIQQDRDIIANHEVLVSWLLSDSATIDRAAFARYMGAVWIRNFLVRKETYEQMKSSGSLRYFDIEFLKKMMDYERVTNFAQFRNQDFERKYYTELFIPAIYKAYDLTCQINLDTSNHSHPLVMEKLRNHQDLLSGTQATTFRHDMGAALTLRLERIRRSLDAYRDARNICDQMEKAILELGS